LSQGEHFVCLGAVTLALPALRPPGTEDVKTYPVRIVGDEIQVKLN
jgi:nitrite reductase/ring-hydroxylating ferredoxin subunit